MVAGALVVAGGLVLAGPALGLSPALVGGGLIAFALAALPAARLALRSPASSPLRPEPAPVLQEASSLLATPLLVIDAEAQIVEANAAFAEALGETRLAGRLLEELGSSWTTLASAARRGEIEQPLRVCFLDGSGVKRALRFILHPLNHRRAYLCEAEDRTELACVKEELANARRLESLGSLAGGAAHDFNNMLTSIETTVGLLRDEIGPRGSVDEALELLDLVSDATRRASSLTRKLLALGRRDDVSVEEIDVDLIVGGVVELLERTIDKRVVVTSDLRAPGCTVLVDRAALENALVNLAVNARDAMPEGGALRLSTRMLRADEWHARRPGHAHFVGELGVEIRVDDEGVGMSEDVRARVLDPFFTTKARGEGSGLGLPGVANAVRSMSGKLEIKSRVGAGTSVLISLPARESEMGTPVSLEIPSELRGGLRGRVLVLGTHRITRQRLVAQLRDLGLTPIQAGTPGEAQERMKLHRLELALVHAPELGGEVDVLARALRSSPPSPPVVLLGEGAVSRGAGIYALPGPIDLRVLRRTVIRVMNPSLPPPSESEEARS